MSAKIIIFVGLNLFDMKKILLTISFLAAFVAVADAQSGEFSYGVKAGPTFNWAGAASASCENMGARLGFGLGAVVDYHLSANLAVSSGLEFNLMRFKHSIVDYRRMENFLEYSTVALERRTSATYLEIPLKAKARTEIIDDVTGFVEAGLGIGMNLSARVKDEFEFYGIPYADPRYVDATYRYRLLQAALRFGLGMEYAISSDYSVFAQLSFRHALSNMFTSQLQKQTGSNMKANFIGIEAGVMF